MSVDPKLLSFLETLVHPLQEVELQLQVNGMYSFPEDWVSVQEATSPDFFKYVIEFEGCLLDNGKIYPKVPTRAELEAIEEADKKKKKDTKKQSILTQEDEEALRVLQESIEKEERLQKEIFDSLDQEMKFLVSREDRFKHAQLQWHEVFTPKARIVSLEQVAQDQKVKQQILEHQQANNNGVISEEAEEGFKEDSNLKKSHKTENDLRNFEDQVNEQKGQWIYFYRYPSADEDEVAKLKKGKPKGYQVVDLNKVVLKGWVDLTELTVPGTTFIKQRVFLKQVLGEDPAQDAPNFEIEQKQRTYINISLSVTPAILPQIDENQLRPQENVKPSCEFIPKVEKTTSRMMEYRSSLGCIIDGLCTDYQALYSKEVGNSGSANTASANSGGGSMTNKHSSQHQNQKNFDALKKTLTLQRKEQLKKKTDDFLLDFIKQGKFGAVKERLRTPIVKLCQDLFSKLGLASGYTAQQKDMFYSQVSVFLQKQMRATLTSILSQQRNDLHEDIILTFETCQQEKEQIIAQNQKLSKLDIQVNLASHYEILRKMDLAKKNLLNLISFDESAPVPWLEYAKFSIRNKDFPIAEEALIKAKDLSTSGTPLNKQINILYASVLMRRKRYEQALEILFVLQKQYVIDILLNQLITFVYSKEMKDDEKLYRRHFKLGMKLYLKKLGQLPIQSRNQHLQNPFELPNIKDKENAWKEEKALPPPLKPEQQDEIVLQMIQYFSELEIVELVEIGLIQVQNCNNLTCQIYQSQIHMYYLNFSKANQIYDEIIEKDHENYDVIMRKAYTCFLADKFYEYEEIFYEGYKIKNDKKPNKFPAFLRLGFIYLKRKSWKDAKNIFLICCEMKSTCPLSWLGLGISCLREESMKEAEEAFAQANLYDPYNVEVWGYISLLCLKIGNRLEQAMQCFEKMFQMDVDNYELLEELSQEFCGIDKIKAAEMCLNKIIQLQNKQNNNGQYNMESEELGRVYKNLGNIYNVSLQNQRRAKECYEKALQLLQGDIDKEQIQMTLDNMNLHGLDKNRLDYNSFDSDLDNNN